jgi:hypothetical protein
MIDVIVSVTTENNYKDLQITLNSLEKDLKSVVVMNSNPDVIAPLVENYPTIRLLNDKGGNHVEHFYTAIYQRQSECEALTFLKAGDIICGSDVLSTVASTLLFYPHVNVVHGGVRAKYNYDLYTNPGIAVQGWFFRKEFLEYYTFLKMFQNDIEFAMHLAYISHTKPHQLIELDLDVVQINNPIKNVGQACKHYFNDVLPSQHFFDGPLGLAFICDIICDCYVSYVQVLNDNREDEDVQYVVADIQEFYDYFSRLDLTDDLTILLQAYNGKMQRLYGTQKANSFTRAIPTLTFIDFLNQNGKQKCD